MNPTPLNYEPARLTSRRRLWRRVRLPLLVVGLLTAIAVARPAWRRIDAYLIDRDIARWTRYWELMDDATRNRRADPQARLNAIRAAAATVEPELQAGLTHRSWGVRSSAVHVALQPSWSKWRDLDPDGPPLFSDATRQMFLEVFLSEPTANDLWLAAADRRTLDLRPALQAWPTISTQARADLIRLLYCLGPQTPHAGDLLLTAGAAGPSGDRSADGLLKGSLWSLLRIWFYPASFEGQRDSGLMPHWQFPQHGDVMDPAEAVAAFGHTTFDSGGLLLPSSIAVLGYYGPRAGQVAVDRLPDLDATAKRASPKNSRGPAADAARAIREANALPQPAAQPAP